MHCSMRWARSALFGGSAGDDMKFAKTYVYSDGHFHSDSAVLILISTSLPFRIFKTQHFVSTDELEAARLETEKITRALRESEAKCHSIFQNAAGMGILRTAPDGHYLSINPAGAKMYGYESEEEMIQLVTDSAHQLYIHPEDRKRLNELLEISGFVEGFEAPHYNKDGSIIWVAMNVRVIRDNSGAILYYETISQDITSRKQAEKEILSERSKLKTLSDNAPFGMALIDKEGHFTYINAKFTELFGYDLSDIPDGRTWCRKAYPDAENRHTVISAWSEDLGGAKPGEQKPRVFTVTCKDGTQKIIQFITSTPYFR